MTMKMDDPEVLETIRSSLVYPQNESLRLLKKTPPSGHVSQLGQSVIVDKILKNRTNGFFVECGAYDGEHLSNSLFFELKRNWTGMLIELNKFSYGQLLQKKRHAYSINACLSPVAAPKMFHYKDVRGISGLTEYHDKSHERVMTARHGLMTKPSISVVCFPLYSLMLAVGRKRIDYFSLDVEGAELPVLNTIPFDKLYIEIIQIEYMIWGSKEDTAKKLADIRKFFAETKLYKELVVVNWGSVGVDVMFRRIDGVDS